VSNGFGVMIESVVAVLLLLTIGFCIVLDRRLKKLKADEQTLKATISELITATEIAERAIAGLKLTVRETDQGLSERLRDGGRLSDGLARQIDAGHAILDRLAQITVAARPPMPDAVHLPDSQATALAAQAFAARARQRAMSAAA
jgi:uncharacterized protein DUF6468